MKRMNYEQALVWPSPEAVGQHLYFNNGTISDNSGNSDPTNVYNAWDLPNTLTYRNIFNSDTAIRELLTRIEELEKTIAKMQKKIDYLSKQWDD